MLRRVDLDLCQLGMECRGGDAICNSADLARFFASLLNKIYHFIIGHLKWVLASISIPLDIHQTIFIG